MIEILFSESDAGNMKASNSPSRINQFAKETICLGFMMDIGDIQKPMDSTYRKELIHSMLAQNQWDQDSEMEKQLKQAGAIYSAELQRLKQYLEQGETVRIWYSDAPYSICGFYSVCNLLQNYRNTVRVVKLPECIVHDQYIVSYQTWGEVVPEELEEFLCYEKQLFREEVRRYAVLWQELMKENRPLRAVINGRVVSVPENFYDFQIWQRLDHTPIMEARLIGDIIGETKLGVADWWYARRIEHFINQKRIHVLKDSPYKYARLLCLSKERTKDSEE